MTSVTGPSSPNYSTDSPPATKTLLPPCSITISAGLAIGMGLFGHSFGGFETNYIVSHTDVFAAAIESAGPSDTISMYITGLGHANGNLRSQSIYESRQSRIGSAPWQRQDLYLENSPVLRADKVTTPLLIIHNAKDFLVPVEQAKEWFYSLQRLQKRAWWLHYASGGHGIDKPTNCMDVSIRITQFRLLPVYPN